MADGASADKRTNDGGAERAGARLSPPHAGPDSPPFIAMVRRSIKRVAGGADIIRIKFFWLLSPELRWLGQPGNGNLTVCDVMVDVLSEQLVSGSV